MKQKKRIVGTMHGLKFFRADGWMADELDACCRRGGVRLSPGQDPFYFLDAGSSFNAFKLLSKPYELIRCPYNPMPDLNDAEYVKMWNY